MLRRSPNNMKSLHISQNIARSGCRPSNFRSSFTQSPQVFLPLHSNPASSTLLPNHLRSHTPDAQTISIYHASPQWPHAFNTQKTTNGGVTCFAFYGFNATSTNLSHHHTHCPLQAMLIFSLHCPSSVYLSLYMTWCTMHGAARDM